MAHHDAVAGRVESIALTVHPQGYTALSKTIKTIYPSKISFEKTTTRLKKFSEKGEKVPFPILEEMLIGTCILEGKEELSDSDWRTLLDTTDEQVVRYKHAGLRLKSETEGVKREDLHIAVTRKLVKLFPLDAKEGLPSLETAVQEILDNSDQIQRNQIITALHYLDIAKGKDEQSDDWDVYIYSSVDEVKSLFANALHLSIGTDNLSIRPMLDQAAGIDPKEKRTRLSEDEARLWEAFKENRQVSPEKLSKLEDELIALYAEGSPQAPGSHEISQEGASAEKEKAKLGKRPDREDDENADRDDGKGKQVKT